MAILLAPLFLLCAVAVCFYLVYRFDPIHVRSNVITLFITLAGTALGVGLGLWSDRLNKTEENRERAMLLMKFSMQEMVRLYDTGEKALPSLTGPDFRLIAWYDYIHMPKPALERLLRSEQSQFFSLASLGELQTLEQNSSILDGMSEKTLPTALSDKEKSDPHVVADTERRLVETYRDTLRAEFATLCLEHLRMKLHREPDSIEQFRRRLEQEVPQECDLAAASADVYRLTIPKFKYKGLIYQDP
jgi:hypothetical protein